jgi:prepilin-type N-terminal cleavage/methylation domain-containing protein
MKRDAGGFTLVELLIAVILFAVVAASMVAIEQMGLRRQAASLGESTADSNANAAGRVLRRELSSISYIETPPSGTLSTQLRVWENVNPGPGSGAGTTLASGLRRFKYFCVLSVSGGTPQQVRDDLLFYSGDYPAASAWPMPAIVCGADPPAGAQRVMVAGGVTGMSVAATFNRPLNNLLQVGYVLTLNRANRPTVTVNHTTEVTLRGSLQ